jgi:hypothetical protein
MNYSGKGTNYLAVNKLTGEDLFYRRRQNGKMVEGYSFKRGFIKHGFNFS